MDYDPRHLGDDTLPATPEMVRTIVKRARQLAMRNCWKEVDYRGSAFTSVTSA